MTLKPGRSKTAPPNPRKEGQRDQRGLIVENPETEVGDRDLVRGEGGTIDIPSNPDDLNRDD